MTEFQVFEDIHPDNFIHPRDRAALEALRAVPLLDRAIEKVTSGTIEDVVHAELHVTSVRLGPNQYPSIYRFVERACTILDVEVPEVYLDSSYAINASAFGMKRYAITLYAGLIDLLDDDEILSVVGHEVGHIACDHMKYKSLAGLLSLTGGVAMDQIPILGGVFNLGMQQALRAWDRAAEYSCDRAALLVTGDPELVATTLARLAGTTRRFRDEFNLDEVLLQARDYEKTKGTFASWVEATRKISQTHPDPIDRAYEVYEWQKAPQYQRILDNCYRRRGDKDGCPSCGAILPEGIAACLRCDLRLDPEFQTRCSNPETPHVCDVTWNYCPLGDCGHPVR